MQQNNNPNNISISNNPISLGISVEGPTEAFFVNFVLARYLADYNIVVQPPVILGGNVTIDRVASSLLILSRQNNYATSLHDFYGFKLNKALEGVSIEALENLIKQHPLLNSTTNVIPYLQKYEFEALLLSDIDILCSHIYHNPEKQAKCVIDLNQNINGAEPEEVNNSINTAPSKRIFKIQRRYKKSVSGFLVAQDIGIEKIKQKCPRFNAWLSKIVSLSTSQ